MEKGFLVNYQKIDDRFDPEFYHPSYFEILDTVEEWEKISNIYTNISHPPEYERDYSAEGVQLIRSQNVRPVGINFDESPVFFSPEFLKKKKVVYPQKGDILIVRSGVNAGDVAMVEESTVKAIIGADTLLLRVDNTFVPKFIQVFFYTDIGKKLMNRYVTGATNKHVSPSFLKKVPLPKISSEKQKKCISLFEESLETKAQKEAEAEKLLNSIDDYLLSELGITLPEKDTSLANRMFATSFQNLSGRRYDPNYYSKYYKELKKSIEESNFKQKELKSLCHFLQGGKTPASSEYSNSKKTEYPIVKVGSYTNNYINLEKVGYTKSANNSIEIKKDDIFILSAAHQAEYVGKHIKILTEIPVKRTSYVGELINVRANTAVCNPMYLFSLLNLEIFKTLINREKTGQTSHVYGKDLQYLQMPAPSSEKQNEIANHIKKLRNKAKQLKQEARQEVENARWQVEEIILEEG